MRCGWTAKATPPPGGGIELQPQPPPPPDRHIVRALAFCQGWWGVRPKSPVTSQPPSFGRSPVSGRSSYTLFHGGLPTALLTIPLRDAVWPLTFMLDHKAVPHA